MPGASALHDAVRRNDLVALQQGINAGADLEQYEDDESPVEVACFQGNAGALRALLAAGASASGKRAPRTTAPLHLACRQVGFRPPRLAPDARHANHAPAPPPPTPERTGPRAHRQGAA